MVNNVKRRYISGASTWICTSDKTIDYFKYYGADEKKVFKYPFTSIYEKNVLSEPLYPTEKKEIRARLGIPEEKMIISVGQFIYRKGFDVLLEACKELGGDTGIYLIGGKATDEYAEIVKNNRIQNVHFLDFMSPVELAEYYKAADLFAFPTREDIWGLVVNEAAAYGLPIVTTFDCIAGLEMVSDANGKLVPANDTIALKTAIVSVLSDSDNAYKMAKASLAKAKAFTVEKMAKRHDEIIEEFIDERKKSKKEK